jgi:hypothetical protein
MRFSAPRQLSRCAGNCTCQSLENVEFRLVSGIGTTVSINLKQVVCTFILFYFSFLERLEDSVAASLTVASTILASTPHNATNRATSHPGAPSQSLTSRFGRTPSSPPQTPSKGIDSCSTPKSHRPSPTRACLNCDAGYSSVIHKSPSRPPFGRGSGGICGFRGRARSAPLRNSRVAASSPPFPPQANPHHTAAQAYTKDGSTISSSKFAQTKARRPAGVFPGRRKSICHQESVESRPTKVYRIVSSCPEASVGYHINHHETTPNSVAGNHRSFEARPSGFARRSSGIYLRVGDLLYSTAVTQEYSSGIQNCYHRTGSQC